MRTHPILLLALALTLAACNDSGGPSTGGPSTGGPSTGGPSTGGPSTGGTLLVSTASRGNAPDPNGDLLTVDGIKSRRLSSTGTAPIPLPAGQHTLQLLDMAEQCWVSPATTLHVEVASEDTTAVAFEVTCSVPGARITVRTTGLDLDTDGYRLEVDGGDRGVLTLGAVTRLEPGSHAIALTGLAPNCTIDGPNLHPVNIVEAEITQIELVVVCTATTGVIRIVVEATGIDVDGEYKTLVDGASSVTVPPSGPAYRSAVAAGDHVISLVTPANCSVRTRPQRVTVTAGALIRDTVEVSFSVTCRQAIRTLRITVPTTGPVRAGHRTRSSCAPRGGSSVPGSGSRDEGWRRTTPWSPRTAPSRSRSG